VENEYEIQVRSSYRAGSLIIIEWIFEKQDRKAWSGGIWLRIRTIVRLL
jgi:hypothetical protein